MATRGSPIGSKVRAGLAVTSGAPKNYHGGPLRVPWGPQAEAGGVFPWEPTHWVRETRVGFGFGFWVGPPNFHPR